MGFFLNISWTLQKQEIDCSYYFPDWLSSTSQLLSVLLASEEEIQTRSKAIESHWSPDKYQDKSSGKNEFSSFKVHLTWLYNKCTPNSKWFGKETLYTFRAWKKSWIPAYPLFGKAALKFILLISATTCACTCLS